MRLSLKCIQVRLWCFSLLICFIILIISEIASADVQPTPTPSASIYVAASSPTPSAQAAPVGISRFLSIREWTTDTWTAIAAIVAFIALIQPWVLGLLRWVFRRGTVDIHETGNIEIGFSGYGHTIGLTGTLRALHKDMFILGVKLQLVRPDGLVRVFEWKAFRNPKLTIGTTGGQAAEISFDAPTSFMVTPLQPQKFNILFADEQSLISALPVAQMLQQEWLARIQKFGIPKLNPQLLAQPEVSNKLRHSFVQQANSETYRSLAELLTSLNYWRAGKYKLTMLVQTTRPNKTITKTWFFTLPQSELEKLESNVNSIVEDVCGMPLSMGDFSFVSVPFNS